MANKLEELIQQVREDQDSPEGLLELLEDTQKKLPEGASEAEIDEALHKALMEHMVSRLGEDSDVSISDDDRKYMDQTVNLVKEVFAEEHWRYSEDSLREDLHIFDLGFGIHGCRLRMRVYIEADPRVCRIDAILPVNADSTYEYVLCKKMVKANYPKRFGALHYDENDGEMSYRYSFPTTHGLYKDDLKRVFLTVASSAAGDYEEVKKCCVGKFKAKEVNEILKNVNRLVSDLSDDDE